LQETGSNIDHVIDQRMPAAYRTSVVPLQFAERPFDFPLQDPSLILSSAWQYPPPQL
jgi:hypothetical protein